jgi:hypothetical protein
MDIDPFLGVSVKANLNSRLVDLALSGGLVELGEVALEARTVNI